MAKFIPKEKMRKKARKELAAQQRQGWAFSPTTKKIDSKKIYSRKKSHAGRDKIGMGFYFFIYSLRQLGDVSKGKVLHGQRHSLYTANL